MRIIPTCITGLILLTCSAAAQDAPLDLLRRVAATYRALSNTTYEFEQIETRESSGLRTETHRRIVGSGAKFREESLGGGLLYLFDGQHRWTYNPERNEFTKATAAAGMPPGLGALELVAYGVKSARLSGMDTLELASGPVDCQVIEVGHVYERKIVSSTYWIDARRNLVLKLQSRTATSDPDRQALTVLTFSKASVGEPVDADLLRFNPPPGAVQVERLSFVPKSKLIGAQCPDFELKALDGSTYSLSTVRGRVLLLHFGSDEESGLLLEMLSRALKPNGLEAIHVQPRFGPGLTPASHTFRMATDPTEKVTKHFGMSYQGMVLIDRSGKILYAGDTGLNSGEFTRALKEAGVW